MCKNLGALSISFVTLVYVPNCVLSKSPDLASYLCKRANSSQIRPLGLCICNTSCDLCTCFTVRNVNKDYERNGKSSQIFVYLGGGMDCVTASYAGVAGSSFIEKEQQFEPFSFYHNLPYHYLIVSVNCPQSYSCNQNALKFLRTFWSIGLAACLVRCWVRESIKLYSEEQKFVAFFLDPVDFSSSVFLRFPAINQLVRISHTLP